MRQGLLKQLWLRCLPVLAVLLAGLPLVISASPAVAGSCGTSSSSTRGASPLIVHAPTLSLETVTWVLAQRHSPLSAADARFIVQASQRAGVDDAFALAVWTVESQDGAAPVPGTHNIGNITAPQGVAWAGHIFAVYPTWQAGIAAWFTLIDQLYIPGGHATDLLTFALYYVHGLTPQDASPQLQRVVANGYVQTLSNLLATFKAHEAALHPGQTGTETGAVNPTEPGKTLASLLPPSDELPPGWAGPGTRPAAGSIRFAGCDAAQIEAPPLVQAALQLGLLLRPNASGVFDHWVTDAPAEVHSQAGIAWDTDFIASAYERATGEAFPAYPAATFWWDGPPGHIPGWERIPAGAGHFPQAGDIAVLLDGALGEVAVVVGVQLPRAGHPGWVLVLQAHASHVLERWTLQPDGTLRPPWSFWTALQGYLRPPQAQ
jgi:hypothetical protein